MTFHPLVTVIVPMFNARRTIARALSSVFAQTYRNFEVVVVDDGSTDDSVPIVREQFGDARLLAQSNAGPSSARNKAASVARGEFLAFLDADDQWHRRKLELQVSAFQRFPAAALCATSPSIQAADGPWSFEPDAPVDSPDDIEAIRFEQLFVNPYLGTPTVMMQRHVFEACGGFDERLHGAEDVDLWLRAAYRRSAIRLRAALVGVARSDSSLTARRGHETDLDNLRVIDKFVQEHPEFAAEFNDVVRGALASVKTRMGSGFLTHGDRRSARHMLASALRDRLLSPRAMYLLLKTWIPAGRE
jgi:glycosyltransferase involved in cell wall biosynthesis